MSVHPGQPKEGGSESHFLDGLVPAMASCIMSAVVAAVPMWVAVKVVRDPGDHGGSIAGLRCWLRAVFRCNG
jgi:hypothetical protein